VPTNLPPVILSAADMSEASGRKSKDPMQRGTGMDLARMLSPGELTASRPAQLSYFNSAFSTFANRTPASAMRCRAKSLAALW